MERIAKSQEPRAKSCSNGFTLIELLVVIGILGTLMALLFPVFMSSHKKKLVMLAKAEVKALHAAMESYHEALGVYPPDTDDYGTGDVQEIPTSVDQFMICKYLGTPVEDKNTKKTYGPFFIIDPNHPERIREATTGQQEYLDPWGNPYHVDAVHADLPDDKGYVKIRGEPYESGTKAEYKVESVKVWSAGPDKEWKLGSKLNGPGKGPEREDEDNITSWAD